MDDSIQPMDPDPSTHHIDHCLGCLGEVVCGDFQDDVPLQLRVYAIKGDKKSKIDTEATRCCI